MYSEYEPASPEKKIVRTANFPNPRFFGRTDLWISPSRAKFGEESDFEVRSAVAPQKPRQISEKRMFQSGIFGFEKQNVRNRLKRVLAKVRADASHVRGVTKKFTRSPDKIN